MSPVSGYILSIVGIIILGVLITIILPDGTMSKYINNIFALIVVFVVISPVPKLLNYELDTSAILSSAKIQIDENFIYLINEQTVDQLEFALSKRLSNEGYLGVSVVISANIFTSPIDIQKITIDLTNLVIKQDVQHINKYSKIKEIILNNVEVKEDEIVFYG